jgi:type II restriction enzyme
MFIRNLYVCTNWRVSKVESLSIVPSPWVSRFKELVRKSSRLDFASPFIKVGAINEILKSDICVRGITVFSYPRFIRGASDLEALTRLINKDAEMRSLAHLHAKVYMFDTAAVITSANLTLGGLSRNIEYGVMVTDEDTMKEIRTDFEEMFLRASPIKPNWITYARRILDEIPPEQRYHQVAINQEVPPNTQIIVDSLTGWMREVYLVLQELPLDEFRLRDIYYYEEHFSRIYPRNRHIKDKIRQVLQYLRDMGLVEFLGSGRYRRR